MEWMAQFLAVGGVLALLGVTLWWLRSKGYAGIPVAAGRKSGRFLQAVERLPLSPQHSLHAVRFGDRLLLIALSPGSCAVVEQAPYVGQTPNLEANR